MDLFGGILFTLLVLFCISAVTNSISLWVSSKIVNLRKQDFFTAVLTAIFYSIAELIIVMFYFALMRVSNLELFSIPLHILLTGFLISILIYVYLIKIFYGETWGKAIAAFIFLLVLSILLDLLLNFALPGLIGTALR